jgi:hydroxymethylpyrimidine pyrophosphatase-like HAD family hydrolase
LAVFAKSSREVELKKSKISVELPAYKINIMSFSKKKIKFIHDYLLNKYPYELEVSYTHPLLLEITEKDVNKGYALSMIANSLNLTKNNIACIGDSGNDVPMTKIAGLSIGLKSRSQLLQKSVDIYLKNKNNGVAKAIDNHLMKDDIELIVSDLDGTLLDDETKLINRDTSKIINRAIKQKKCQIAIATGRGLDDGLLVYKNLKIVFSSRRRHTR